MGLKVDFMLLWIWAENKLRAQEQTFLETKVAEAQDILWWRHNFCFAERKFLIFFADKSGGGTRYSMVEAKFLFRGEEVFNFFADKSGGRGGTRPETSKLPSFPQQLRPARNLGRTNCPRNGPA